MITITTILFGMFLIYMGAIPKKRKPKFGAIVAAPTGGKIQSEMIPRDMHGKNVRSRVEQKTWQAIAHRSHDLNRQLYRLQPQQCEVCKSNGHKQGFGHALEAHEEWSFSHVTRTQKLMRIRSLCPLCHKAVHIGLAKKQGYEEQTKKHIQQVNGWTLDQVEAHIAQALQTVSAMSQMGQYKLDLTYLNSNSYAGTHKFRFTENETSNCRPGIFY